MLISFFRAYSCFQRGRTMCHDCLRFSYSCGRLCKLFFEFLDIFREICIRMGTYCWNQSWSIHPQGACTRPLVLDRKENPNEVCSHFCHAFYYSVEASAHYHAAFSSVRLMPAGCPAEASAYYHVFSWIHTCRVSSLYAASQVPVVSKSKLD